MVIPLAQSFLENVRTKFRAVLAVKGTPHSIALGAAVGLFWNFIPSIGLGPFLSLGLAKVMKGSGVASLTMNLATGFFIPMFYSMNMITGRFVKGDRVETKEIEETLQGSFQVSLDKMEGVVEQPVSFFHLDAIQNYTADFFLGATINAISAAAFIYLIVWLLLYARRHSKSSEETSAEEI